MQRSPIRGLQTHNPEVIRWFGPITLQLQISILRSFAVHFGQHRAASFIHPCLYDSQLPTPLQYASRICASYGLEEGLFSSPKSNIIRRQIGQMLRLAAKAGSFSELVAYVQAIALLQIFCLLEAHGDSEEQAERDDEMFRDLAHLLYIQAPVQLPKMLGPWRAWLFAESVRRTILVCHIILAVHGVLRRGYAVHLLCVEALPFDMRSQLWNADTADAWEVATAVSHDPPLVSPRQFTTLRQQTEGASPLEDLLLQSFKYRGSSDF